MANNVVEPHLYLLSILFLRFGKSLIYKRVYVDKAFNPLFEIPFISPSFWLLTADLSILFLRFTWNS